MSNDTNVFADTAALRGIDQPWASLRTPRMAFDLASPVAVASLMLSLPLRRQGSVVVLQPDEDDCTLLVQRGSATMGAFKIRSDVAGAAAVRLALIADIDPLADGGSLARNARRVKVRAGDDSGELLVSMGASQRGLDVEVRALEVNGGRPEQSSPGPLKRCPSCGTYQPAKRWACEADGADLVPVEDRPGPGGTIGVYCVLSRLGDGGMATVFAAEHALIGRPAAIKVLHRTMAQNPVLVRRFLAEARAASRIRHPNVVEVFDFGLLGNGNPFLVMERIEGEALDARIRRAHALRPATALRIAREVALALGAAHDGGVVHNDLKPANILLLETSSEEETPLKLVDFGAASRLGAEIEERDGLVIGTPRYMSPEHARGEPTDGRADLYALGVVLFEMLSGAVPFHHDDPFQVLSAHVSAEPPPVTSPNAVLPQTLVKLVMRALRKRPEERHQTAAEMVADLDRALVAVRRSDWRKWLP